MALFFNFCNICYKIDDGSLKHISEERMKYLKDTLITFVGYADIINHNDFYLCHLCCEEIIRFDKFRETCVSHLGQFRQKYFNKLSKLELLDNTAAGKTNTLKKFAHEEILRRNCPLAICTQYHEVNISGGLNKNDSVFNRQITNLQSQRNEYEFIDDGNDLSVKNSVTECDESRVACTNEENMENEIIRFEEIKSEKFSSESDGDYNGFDINKDNENDTSKIKIMKEFDFKSERESNDAVYFTRTYFENESYEHAHHVKMPVVNNSEVGVDSGLDCAKQELYVTQESSLSEVFNFKSETIEDEFGDDIFEIVNVSPIAIMEACGPEDIASKEAEVAMKSPRSCKNKSIAPIMIARPNSLHVRPLAKSWCPAVLTSPNPEPHICAVCQESFRTITCLTRHKRTHSSDKPHKCTVCNKTFCSLSALTVHKRIHTGERPYTCTTCNKAFTQSSNLTTHERIHTGVRPYKCTVCNKAFSNLFGLATHDRVHTGERPYKCATCNKAFTQSATLTAHERVHTGTRPYKCTVCNKAFSNLSILTAHNCTHQ